MVNVICMKWGTKYPASDVNRLRSMVRRHLSRPHRFICFTDESAGIDPSVEIRPLPQVNVPPGPERCWRKLGVFDQKQTQLEGVTLFLDLDIIVLDSLDPFFEHPGDFCIIRDWLRGHRSVGNSSVFRFVADRHQNVLPAFHADTQRIAANYRCDQDFISVSVGPVTWWPEEWCRSFKYHCMYSFPFAFFRAPKRPAGTRLLIFHGFPKPEEAIAGTCRKFGLRYAKPSPWLAEHWQ
ncbi:MAG: hypothetical protein EPO07_03540 [Verrucomicrobia bacterium]|nr:MAG: hypothetical protein EPO07_03540 [Verrucomicrobiota bacterium]